VFQVAPQAPFVEVVVAVVGDKHLIGIATEMVQADRAGQVWHTHLFLVQEILSKLYEEG